MRTSALVFPPDFDVHNSRRPERTGTCKTQTPDHTRRVHLLPDALPTVKPGLSDHPFVRPERDDVETSWSTERLAPTIMAAACSHCVRHMAFSKNKRSKKPAVQAKVVVKARWSLEPGPTVSV